ncbi:Lrp/AsnC family transcriptional regulator [Mucilaginibacter aquaedulcis]|uniref:Lrp/AsnC family transcriptional regulator n=1 Tax=Mucilaginibacter aquaedulcis TaxID=1187081 RepID=UPI0025B45965|nr:Lrp/AsnC family transcriptional regulator [Mucilaginibacter aquaedulcis]MDN3548953.1 Lrp/AsnC family transcriptional regulator [Mucilaginibacter aquaedulcis]
MQNKQLDKADLKILELLQQDGRMTHKEIGYRLSKSVTPVHTRIKRLEDEGYIKGYVALVDAKKVGRGLIGYTQVYLKEHSQEALSAFQREVVKFPEVLECYHMTGVFDFLLRIAISDMDAYNVLLMTKLSKLPDVGNMQSFFVLSAAKEETAYPVSP